MSTISTITSGLVASLQGVGAAPEAAPASEATTSSVPRLLDALVLQGGIASLGLSAPRNHGDIEAIFAEIASKYGAEAEKARGYAEAAEDAKRSTALTAAAGNLALFAALGSVIIAADANIKKQEAVIKVKTEQINTKTAEKNALQDQYDAYRAEWNSNAATILENGGKIIALGTELAAVELARVAACGIDSGGAACRDLTSQANSLNGQIDALESQNSQLIDRNLFLDGEMFRLIGEITKLGLEIFALEAERTFAQVSMDGSKAAKDVASALLTAFAVVLMPFSVDLALRTIGEIGRASFETSPGQKGIDQAIEDAVNDFTEQSARMGMIDTVRKAVQLELASDSPSLDTLRELLDSMSQPPAERPEAAVDTAAILGLLSLIRQSVQGGIQGQANASDTVDLVARTEAGAAPKVSPMQEGGKPSALDLIREAMEKALPPGQGDADAVANRAAGLAGGLALVRGALGQLAEGESASGTQMPGPTGRLTIAI